MRQLTGAATALLLVLISACGERPEPKPLPAPPVIKAFVADKDQIRTGESVELSWTVENATAIELVDQTGAALPTEGDASNGTATVTPAASNMYVLRATGNGGRHSAFVQVAVDEDLKQVFLVAVPREINAGDATQLLWSAFNATSAKLQTASGQELPLDAAAGSGVVEVTPDRTELYTLVATGSASDEAMTASTDVKVRPMIASFTATPQAAKPGDSITFTWTTRGAAQVVLAESTFGELHKVSAPAETANVDQGTFTWTVPATLPNGNEVLDTHPLHFTLSAKQNNPQVTAVKEISGYVGEGPMVLELVAPPAVTEGKGLTLRWRTAHATRLQVLSNGAPIYEPLAKNTAEIARGQITLPALTQDTTFAVKLWSHLGAESSKETTVRVVKMPSIGNFTLPAQINAMGDPASASWTTTDATRVVIRTKGGPSVYSSETAATVAQGTTQLFPGTRTTFVLEAWNDAGDFVAEEREVIVALPGTFSAQPSPLTRGEPLNVTWDFDKAVVSLMYGDPGQVPVKSNPGSGFFELEGHMDAQEIVFDNPNDDVQRLTALESFRFPFLGLTNEKVWVSTNGFVAFNPTGAMADNQTFGGSAALPPMIAPFWDDLKLGAGKVLYLVEGTSFPRRLIVQWNRVQTADPQSELSFQVQLFETGEFRFAYKNLTGAESGGESAAIGWQFQDGMGLDVANPGSAVLVNGDEFAWFVTTNLQGGLTVAPERSGAFSMYAKLANGNFAVFSAPVNVIAPGAVVVNEAMVAPDAFSTQGQWIELRNTTFEPVDLSGTVLTAFASNTSFTLPEGLILDGGEIVVIGQSTDPLVNGGAPVDLAWTGLQPDSGADDTILLTASGEISSLRYTSVDITPGVSIQPEEALLYNWSQTPGCPRTKTFGANGSLGTPGTRNESCFFYVKDPIPSTFRDISGSGTPIFNVNASNINGQYLNDLDVKMAPIPFFGQPQARVHVSVHGYLSFGPITENWDNYAMPGANSSPVHVAPFWDRLDKRPASNGNVFYQRFDPLEDPATPAGHWVFQWHQVSHYEWGGSNDDDLNFQVKLFDDGAIEYHYGTMNNGSGGTLFADGRDATIWLENPGSSIALPIGQLHPVIQPNSAYRFTPNP